jgi:hypothetical protein
MRNLWEETLDVLRCNGLTWDDVIYVCGNHFLISKENFEELARKTDYDAGFGAPEIATDLKILGKCWWLSRGEYDGSEWWDFNKMFDVENLPTVQVNRLSVNGTDWCGWKSLRECNEGT